MKKYGNKLIAILLTAVCLIGVLPLTVFGTTQQVCYPAVGAWYPQHRFSKSGGGFVFRADVTSLIVPLPDESHVVISGLDDYAYSGVDSYYLDATFNFVANAVFNYNLLPITLTNVPTDATFVVIPFEFGSPYGTEIVVNDVRMITASGDYIFAHPPYCEDIVIPDPPETLPEGVQIQPILDMWEDILLLNETPLLDFYNHLIKPMGLIIGIPLIMALLGTIIFLIGGKKR